MGRRRHHAELKTPITVALNPELVAAIDRLAKLAGISRSAFAARALEVALTNAPAVPEPVRTPHKPRTATGHTHIWENKGWATICTTCHARKS